MEGLECDVCVIGGGAGGLSVAAGAAQMGARVILIEHGVMGGECLNTGCVPSKALLAAGKRCSLIREAEHFGIETTPPTVDFTRLYRHIQETIDAIAPEDSVERFTALGVQVIQESAAFIDPTAVETESYRIKARFFVIATGSRPAIPTIPGLTEIPYLTNETLFTPRSMTHLAILGGGPIGVEMAQAHRRLGIEVSVIEQQTLLPRDDPDLVDILRSHLREEGIVFYEQAALERIDPLSLTLHLKDHPPFSFSHLLVATGRRPNTDSLNLEAANIQTQERGIVVDRRLRATNPRVFALGDVIGHHRFTHNASYQAGVVLKNILFRLPAKVDYTCLPWVTYTDPELAHIGMTLAQAESRYPRCRVLTFPFQKNHRSVAERQTIGLLKAITTPRGRVLGVSCLGAQAGELLLPWALALSQNLNISALAQLIAPYPTVNEATKSLASQFFIPFVFGKRVQTFVRFLKRIGL